MMSEFIEQDGSPLAPRLCGIRIARSEGHEPPFMSSLIRLRVDGQHYGPEGLEQEDLDQSGRMARCTWRVGETGLRVESLWHEDAATGVLSRRDTATNTGDRPHTLMACRTSITLPKGVYECYA